MDDDDVRNAGASGTSLGDNPQARGVSGRGGRTDDPGIKGREALEDAKRKVGSLGHEAAAQGKAAVSRQKEGAAEQLGSVASALHTAADDLQARDQAQAGRFMSYAADQLQMFARRIRDKDIDSLIDDASEMGRRSPAAFFAGSVAVGFLVSRFIKSSRAARERESGASGAMTGPLSSPRPGGAADRGPGTSPITGDRAYGASIPPAGSAEAARATTGNSMLETDGGRYE